MRPGWVSPVLLVDGIIRGVWRHEVRGNRLDVTIRVFEKIPAWVRRGTEAEAVRLAAFFGRELNLIWPAKATL